MRFLQAKCDHCSGVFDVSTGHYNRAKARKARLFCSRECSGLGRRVDRSDAEKKRLKAEYDRSRRERLADLIKAEKAAYYQRTKDPKKEAEARKKRMPRHVEYCRRPEYVKWKREYDRLYRAKKHYGEFAECFLLTQDIRQECLERQTDYEIRLAAGTLNKSQQRKRDYARSYSNQPEAGSLGNA